MNRNNRTLIFLLNLVFSIVVAFFIYNSVYCKYDRECEEKKNIYEKFYNINTQIDEFSDIQYEIVSLKDSLSEEFSVYEDLFYSNEQNINAYKVRILDLLKEIEIPIQENSVLQVNLDDSIEIHLKLTANYNQICKLLFMLERYSIVSLVNMDYKENVEIKVSPVLYSSKINKSFSGKNSVDYIDDEMRRLGYFKEISNKILEIKDIEYIQKWSDFEPVPKSPFYYYIPEKKVVKKTGGKVIIPTKPSIKIDGIMYEKRKPMVIIDGKFYYVGDTVANSKIVQINKNDINVRHYGKIFTIKMEN